MNGWKDRVSALFVAHRARLESLVARRTGRRDQAGDLVQESFARLIAAGSSGSVEQDTRMLYTIARNATIDSNRSIRRRHNALASLVPEQFPQQAPSPIEALEARDTLAQLAAILQTLPQRSQDVFILRRVHGLSHAEIARALGVSVSTVQKHLLRVLRTCSAKMPQALSYEPGDEV